MRPDQSTRESTSQDGNEPENAPSEHVQVFDRPAVWRAQVIADFRLRGEERCAAASPAPGFPQLLTSLLHLTEELAEGPILDVGGGLGGVASWIERTLRREVICVDASCESLLSARSLFDSLDALVGTAEELPVATGTVRAVVLSGVVSLVDDLDRVLSEVDRVLADEGLVVITDLWAAGAESFATGPNTFWSLEEAVEIAAELDFDMVYVAAADLSTGWWSEAAQQIDDEVRRRHADDDGFGEWVADQQHLAAVMQGDQVLAAGIVLQRRQN